AQRGRDVVGAAGDGLARCAAVARAHTVRRDKAAAAARGERAGVGIAIGLAVGVGRPGRRLLVDGEVGAVVGDVVVIQRTSYCRAQRGRDVVGAARHCLARCASVGCAHAVARQEAAAAACGQWNRIGVTVGLAGWVRRPCGILLVDGEVGAVVGDVIVI